MLVVFSQGSVAEDAACVKQFDCLRSCGINPQAALTAEQFESQAHNADCFGLAHFVGLSPETAQEFMARARQEPDRVAIVAGPLRDTVTEFLAPLASNDISLVVVLLGYDNLSAQLRAGIAQLVVKRWLLAVRDRLWPARANLDSHTQECIDGLYLDRPFIDGRKHGRPPDMERYLPHFNRRLKKQGLKTQASIRVGHFVALLRVCAGEFRIGYADAVRICKAQNVITADNKLFDVLGVASRAEALALDLGEAGRRITRFMFDDVTGAPSDLPLLMLPQSVCRWLVELGEREDPSAANEGLAQAGGHAVADGSPSEIENIIVRYRYHATLRSWVGRLVRREEVEGVTQEVWKSVQEDPHMLSLFRVGRDATENESLDRDRLSRLRDLAWSKAGNRKKSIARRRRRELHPESDEGGAGEAAYGVSSSDPVMDLSYRELCDLVREIALGFGAVNGQIIIDRVIDSMSWTEIGERTGLGATAAQLRFQRRRDAFKERLRQQGVGQQRGA